MIGTTPYLEVTVAGLSQGAVLGLLALGLVLIYRTTGVMNFGHWAIGLMGLTLYALLADHVMPVGPAVIVGLVGAVVAGILSYRFVFRRVPRANQIVSAKGTPEEAEAFRAWILECAQRAADAAKEGGFMGFHAERVSQGEKDMLAQLGSALGSGE